MRKMLVYIAYLVEYKLLEAIKVVVLALRLTVLPLKLVVMVEELTVMV